MYIYFQMIYHSSLRYPMFACCVIIRVYLVVVDIRIVDFHMYLGEDCLQVLYSYIYRPRPQCNTIHYTPIILFHDIRATNQK